MIFPTKMSRIFFPGLFLAVCFALSAPVCTPVSAAPAANSADIEAVKKALLEDPLFLSHLRDKISADSLNTDIIRQYLLKNPGIILEMQEILTAKANQQTQDSKEQARILKENEQILYHTAGDFVLGDKNAKIVLLEFFDYNCRYCKRDFPEEKKLVDANKNVKIIMKDYPILSDDSIQAHLIAQVVKKAAPEKYPAFHEKMMGLQGRATETSSLAVAQSLGLDKKVLQGQMHNSNIQNAMLQSAQIAYRLGLNYAPVFILREKILGAVTMPALLQIIAEEEKSLAKGK